MILDSKKFWIWIPVNNGDYYSEFRGCVIIKFPKIKGSNIACGISAKRLDFLIYSTKFTLLYFDEMQM